MIPLVLRNRRCVATRSRRSRISVLEGNARFIGSTFKGPRFQAAALGAGLPARTLPGNAESAAATGVGR
jgi:hypothetical protein